MANLSSYLPGGIDPAAVTITGGTINGTTIGASTAAAGTFTNLTATGTVTLPANGVSGDAIDGGTISNFTSTGIDDNATSTAITIDSSQNVGIGTNAPNRQLFVKDTASRNTAAKFETTVAGAYAAFYDVNSTYDLSVRFGALGDNAIIFAGNAERMRIDSSGNVGIGRTPATRLDVQVTDNTAFSSSSSGNILTLRNTSTTSGSFAGLALSSAGTGGDVATAHINVTGTTSGSGNLVFSTRNSSVIAERMRITSSGTLLVGTTTPNSALSVALGSTTLPAAGASTSCAMFSNSVSGGLYGTQIGALSSGVGYIQVQRADGVAGTYDLLVQPNGGEVRIAGTTDRGNYKLQVNTTGVWGQGSYVNGSDARWKDNVQTLDCNCLDIVNNLRSVSYTYNEDSGASDLTTPHLGFIAQEVEQATGDHPWLSGLVTEDSEGYKSMAYQELIPVLTKAIQEQQAMIETLQAEVAALKGA